MNASHNFFHLTMVGILMLIVITCFSGNRHIADECSMLSVTKEIVTDTAYESDSPQEDLALPGNTHAPFSYTSPVIKSSSRLVYKYRHWLGASAFFTKDTLYSLILNSYYRAQKYSYAVSTVSQRLSILCKFII